MENAFIEKQRFIQWWLWLLLLGLASVFVYGLYKQIILGIPFGDKPMSDLGLILFSIAYFVFTVCFLSLKLVAKIDRDGIEVRYFPFVKKQLKWRDIKKMEFLNYDFVGWGIRFGTQYGTVYNVSGNQGLSIELSNGKRLLIGTQKQEEMELYLKKISPKK